MKVTQFGKIINNLDELKDGRVVIHSGYTIQDLPETILIGQRVHIPRETWCELVRVLAQKDKLEAYLWVNQETKWCIKETKLFVDGLLEECPWIYTWEELPKDFETVDFGTTINDCLFHGFHETGNGWIAYARPLNRVVCQVNRWRYTHATFQKTK